MEASLVPPEAEQDTPTVRLLETEATETEPRAAGTIYKVTIGIQTDDNLPRDNMFVTPHVYDVEGRTSPATLATTVATKVVSWLGGSFRGQVKVYLEDFNPGVPHNPLGTADFGTVGSYATSSGPREISLCLSYYAGQNTKRYRGRLYIPHAWIRKAGGLPSDPPGTRPTAQTMATALAFGTTVLKPLGGEVGIDWRVASTVDRVSRRVTDYWVDDEWDIIRSRGYRGTTRQTAIT
jgi:hypothetical protein